MASTQVKGAQILDATITDTDIAAANTDGVAGTPSIRTLGTGAQQAAAGNHTHAATYAPIGSAFVTIAADATLTAERSLAVSADLLLTDAGANSTITVALAANTISALSWARHFALMGA